jgi:hypothetical protein
MPLPIVAVDDKVGQGYMYASYMRLEDDQGLLLQGVSPTLASVLKLTHQLMQKIQEFVERFNKT